MMRYSRNKRMRRSITNVDITLTPLIDTALTLLIIFMVTTPMIQQAIKIELPKGHTNEGRNDAQELVVTINKEGTIFFNNKQVSIDELGTVVKNHMVNENQQRSVWVRSDGASYCDTLVSVIDCIKVVGGVKDINVAVQKKSLRSA